MPINLTQSSPPVTVRYVVLHHTGVDPEHYDLMVLLPGEATLVTWRILTPPSKWSQFPPKAERIDDHRQAYLEYEGEISNNRGQVKRVRQGHALFTGSTENVTLTIDPGTKLSLPSFVTPIESSVVSLRNSHG